MFMPVRKENGNVLTVVCYVASFIHRGQKSDIEPF